MVDKNEYDNLLKKLNNNFYDGNIDETEYRRRKNYLDIDYAKAMFTSGIINKEKYDTLKLEAENDLKNLSRTSINNKLPELDNHAQTDSGEDHITPGYKIISKLGQGGMASVFLAEDLYLGNKVAIKKMLPILMRDKDLVERFRKEAVNQAKLNHINICRIFQFNPQNLTVVLEYIDGQTIEEILKSKGRIPEKDAIHIIKGILKGLNHAHQKGIVHRDIKPSNIIIEKNGEPKITDFGIALIMGEDRKTKTGIGIGTPEYMSPEQIKGEKNIDHRTDVYSVGILIYEMLSGSLPFENTNQDFLSDYSIKNFHVNVQPAPLCQKNPLITKELSDIVLKALNKNPDERYPGCGYFLSIIEKYENKIKNESEKQNYQSKDIENYDPILIQNLIAKNPPNYFALRIKASLLDFIGILLLYFSIFVLISLSTIFVIEYLRIHDEIVLGIAFFFSGIIFILVYIFSYTRSDTRKGGLFGKSETGLIVTDMMGNIVSMEKSLKRTSIKFLTANPFIFIFLIYFNRYLAIIYLILPLTSFIICLRSKTNQSIHDIYAKTLVLTK